MFGLRTGFCILAALCVAGSASVAAGGAAVQGIFAAQAGPRLVSADMTGVTSNGTSSGVATDLDGSVVAFYSDATRLVGGDTNQARDVFVYDAATAAVERVSVSNAGGQANRASHVAGGAPSLSADGRFVAFYSDATNLVDGGLNGERNVFVRDRVAGTTTLVSIGLDGVAANGPSLFPSISADGRYVAFQSQASNLVPGDTNGASDIFVRDLIAEVTIRPCAIEGNRFSFSPALSADGRVVSFASAATNLVPGDTNGFVDIFVCEVGTDVVQRVSIGSDAAQGNGDSILPAISGDGSLVAFKSLANNLVAGDRNGVVDVFAFDRTANATERISIDRLGQDTDDFSFPPSVSNDGRFVAFGSFATDIVEFDSNDAADVFVRDREIGITLVVGRNGQGEHPNRGTPDIPPAISGDGVKISFVTFATNLSANDRNQSSDIYFDINPFFGPGSCPNGDEDCSDGQVCVDGFCVDRPATPTPTPTAPPANTGTPTPTPTPTPTFRPCETDDDCPGEEICRGGYCRQPRPCDPEDPLVDLLMCFERETCINNLCECGGDCNLDGYVLGTEITRSILILAGARGLDQCAAADIDLDGAVMGNEITLSIINLDEGCLQEGRPLIFAHDRGDTVELAMETAIAPGGNTVDVTIGLSGSMDEVATVQLDVLFDAASLRLSDPAAACRKDPRLGDQVLIAALPNEPEAPAGMDRLRLFVGSTSAPIGTFGDGAVISCTFELADGSEGGVSTLRPDRLNVGDDRGNTFRVIASDGTLEIPIPEPTPIPTPAKPCSGDCDGDGAVLGTEITRAVRIMIGDVPLPDCLPADADGDGEVFVTDITKSVINMGLGCPE